jgi:lysophospholipase L1-like esterase
VSPLYEILRNLALSVIVTVVFLAALEGVARFGGLAPPRTLAYPDMESWERYPGPFEPGQDFVDRIFPNLPHHIRINSLGFRGEDFPLEKAEGSFRILCVGDSYVFGDYVQNDETFPAALQSALGSALHGKKAEVINGGVNGYTILDEAELAVEKGFGLDPDLLVLTFVMNDLADMTRRLSSRENQRIEAQRMSESFLTPIKKHLRQTALYNWLFKLKAGAMARSGADPTLQAIPQRHLLRPPFGPETEALFERYGSELIGLARAAEERGVGFLFVLFPFYEQSVKGAPSEAQAHLAALASQAGITTVDLLPAFLARGAEASALYLMPRNHHPSAEGYRLAASVVAEAIVGMQAASLPGGSASGAGLLPLGRAGAPLHP